jgi:replication factor C subunit 3/5
MVFLIDETIPKSYEDVFFHQDIYDRLNKMSKDNSIPHVIFHGPVGSGKKTMTNIFLKMIYGDSINKLYSKKYYISGSGSKIKEEIVKNSEHHIIINPTGTNFDRYLVHEIIKNYATTNTIDFTLNSNCKFRTILITDLDKLSHSAQHSLRRMIEVNASKCRFIMWCNNLSNVINPLKSRCVCIRVPRPIKGHLFAYLSYISIQKKYKPKTKDLVDIIEYSNCNIKTALWCLQFLIFGYRYKNNYDIAIENIVLYIYNCKYKMLDEIRDIIFNLMITNYKGIDILHDVLNKLLERNLSETCKINIITKTAEIEYNMVRGRRDIIHFDNFISHSMKEINNDRSVINNVQISKVKYLT